MSKKFQYNFTNENELLELRQRVNELQQENNLLKQSLEQLIKVNTELTESIEEFNNQNTQNQYQNQQINQMVQTIEVLNSENEALRKEIQSANYDKSKTSKRVSGDLGDEQQTESLVNVLEELIQSFKNMQTRYDGEMENFEKTIEQYRSHYEFQIRKLQEEYTQKLNTLEPVLMQLHRKDQNLAIIQEKVALFEKKGQQISRINKLTNNHTDNSEEVKRLRAELEQKNKRINQYQALIDKLRVKFNQKI